MTRHRRALLTFALLILLTACPAGRKADPLEATAEKLSELRSGRLTMRFTATTSRGRAGFSIEGPFELRPDGPPVARFRYSVITGRRATTAEFVSNGRRATITSAGRSFEVPPDRLEALRFRPTGDGTVPVDRWVTESAVADGGRFDGVAVDKITGKLDVVNVVNSLAGLVATVGGSGAGTALDQRNATVVRRSVRATKFEALSGRRDRFLRRMTIEVGVAAPGVGALGQALGPYAGVTFRLDVTIVKPNATKVPTAPQVLQ